MKKFWKSKTLWVNALMILGSILSALSGELNSAGVLTLAAVANISLRILTTEALKFD